MIVPAADADLLCVQRAAVEAEEVQEKHAEAALQGTRHARSRRQRPLAGVRLQESRHHDEQRVAADAAAVHLQISVPNQSAMQTDATAVSDELSCGVEPLT